MSENLLLGIIATIVAVILLGMPFWLFGKKKETVRVPDPVPGEEHQPVMAQEMAIVRKMLFDLLSCGIVDEYSRGHIQKMISRWNEGQTYFSLMQEFFARVRLCRMVNWSKLKMQITEQKQALEEIAKMKNLNGYMAANIRICRICNKCLADILKEEI